MTCSTLLLADRKPPCKFTETGVCLSVSTRVPLKACWNISTGWISYVHGYKLICLPVYGDAWLQTQRSPVFCSHSPLLLCQHSSSPHPFILPPNHPSNFPSIRFDLHPVYSHYFSPTTSPRRKSHILFAFVDLENKTLGRLTNSPANKWKSAAQQDSLWHQSAHCQTVWTGCRYFKPWHGKMQITIPVLNDAKYRKRQAGGWDRSVFPLLLSSHKKTY